MKELIQEKHQLTAKVNNIKDLNAAISTENESLKNTLHIVSTPHSQKPKDIHVLQGRFFIHIHFSMYDCT
jgi:hypothetical protein